jgi:hypothetical protein
MTIVAKSTNMLQGMWAMFLQLSLMKIDFRKCLKKELNTISQVVERKALKNLLIFEICTMEVPRSLLSNG